MCGEVPLETRLDWSRMSSVTRVCSVEGCGKPHLARGYCTGHYQRHVKGSDLSTPFRERRLKTCIKPQCDLAVKARNLCRVHYEYALSQEGQVCELPGCEKYAIGKGLCRTHYQLTTRYSVTTAWLVDRWSGGCAICGTREVKLHIDHDHRCCDNSNRGRRSCGGCVRGLLCQGCNLGLGAFKDDPTRLASSIQYLSRNAVN